MLKALLEGIGDLIFPYNCILCSQYVPDKTHPQICSSCLAAIEFNAPPFCLRCSRHLTVYSDQGLCPACTKFPIAFDQAWGTVKYTPVIQKLIHLFKYQQRTQVRHIFRYLFNEFHNRYPFALQSFDLLMPIPLHPVRFRERGFNQSEFIARFISQSHGIPVKTGELIRTRHTQPQSFLDQKERWTNMKGAFRIKTHSDINQKSILLIDDLLTTGATASAAAQILKNAGAKRVGLLVIALAH